MFFTSPSIHPYAFKNDGSNKGFSYDIFCWIKIWRKSPWAMIYHIETLSHVQLNNSMLFLTIEFVDEILKCDHLL